MSPEFGSTCAIFPIDAETLRYLEFSGRPKERIELVEAYAREQGLWHDEDSEEPTYSETLELDLGEVVPSLAGPKRPQDRVSLTESKASFRMALDGLPARRGGRATTRRVARRASPPPTRPPPTAATATTIRATPTRTPARAPAARRSPTAIEATSPVTLADGTETELDHGHVVIAAITSCTNTSNPSVMIGAGLLAKNAVERGLTVKPWVKTSLAPGSKVVMEYYERAKLIEPLEELGFHLVGYGCTTCIGNSGPLPEEISEVVNAEDLAVVSVLSGNRNFEGRINPDVKMNYLASPPLCVAYALAGTMDIDLLDEPLGQDTDGEDVYLKDIWPSAEEVARTVEEAVQSGHVHASPTARCSRATSAGTRSRSPRATASRGTDDSTYVRQPPFFEDLRPEPSDDRGHRGRARARPARRLGDDRPHLARGRDQEGLAGRASTSTSTASRTRTSTPTAPAAATTR